MEDIDEYLNSFEKFTKEPSLQAMEYIMEKFDNPHKKIKCVHVAGTNGKGSICEMLNNVLIKAGYKVGKFISPHLITFNDGICINNEEISNKDAKEIVLKMSKVINEYNKRSREKVKWFEVITSLSFIYFERKKVDIAIIETGLGGLTDCTNIVKPLVSIIANIEYDHIDILGNTIQEITAHKAGIIKENSNTVAIYQQREIIEIIQKVAVKMNNNLHIVEQKDILNYISSNEFQQFDYKTHKNIKINLKGKVQISNACEVLECIDILNENGFDVSNEAIANGLNTVIHRARLEVINNSPLIVFDGGHNENAINNLKENIQQYYREYKKRVYIISILNTKDYKTIVKNLCTDKNAIFIFTNGINNKTYVNNKKLCDEAKQYINSENIFNYELEESIKFSKEKYYDNLILMVGSFYIYIKSVEMIRNLCGDINND